MYDLTAPTNVEYAGLAHPAASQSCPGSACLNDFVVQSDGSRSQGTAAQWVSINPPGLSLDFNNPQNNYGFNTLVADPAVAGTIYMGTNYQGIFKSTDGGATWVKLDTGPGSDMIDGGRIWALALDRYDQLTLYAASGYGSGGPLKSTDGGVSWANTLPTGSGVGQQIGTNDIYNVAVDPYTPGHLLASFHSFWHSSQDSGVVESLDGGSTWRIHNPPAGSGWGAGNSVWFLDNSQTWLLGSQNGGLWRTTDAGQSWQHVSSTNIGHGGIYALYRDPVSGALVIATWNGMLRSGDDGVTWQSFNTGLPYAGYDTVFGDGTHLYTAPSFPDGGDNPQAHGPWFTVPETGGTWTPYSTQTPCNNNICNGPVQMAIDPQGTIYSVNWHAGAWKLATGVPQAVVAPPEASPIPTVTPTPDT